MSTFTSTSRERVLRQAREIVDTAKNQNRDITSDELAAVRVLCDQAKATRNETDEVWGDWGNKPQRRMVSTQQILAAHDPSFACHTDDVRTGRGNTYQSLFGQPAGNDGFHSFGEFLAVLDSGLHHPALRVPSATLLGSVGSSGGFLVPELYAAEMLNKALEATIIAKRADIRPMAAPTLNVAGFDDSTHAGHLYGGLVGYWVPEEGDITVSEPKVRKIQLKATKLACLTKSSNELVSDAPDFERLLGTALTDGLSWYLDYACLTGTGAGQPCGLLNDPALITVAKETSPAQAASTIVYENLTKMLARLHPACYQSAIWVANPTCIPQLLQLTIRVQNAAGSEHIGGSHVEVLSQSGGNYAMLGRPVFFTEKLPALGTVGDIILCDPTQFVLGMRKEVSIEKSGHVYFATDVSAYRAILRADGRGRWSSALTPKNGDTLSWCLALATRS
jgi:HK97 family phage major capsid protein